MVIPLGNYIMVDKKGESFIRFCKAETTEELENIILTKENLYLSLLEKQTIFFKKTYRKMVVAYWRLKISLRLNINI